MERKRIGEGSPSWSSAKIQSKRTVQRIISGSKDQVSETKEEQQQEIDLSNSSLKSFPDQLYMNKSLTRLNASNNQISKIPSGFEEFQQLEEISLYKNRFTSLPIALLSLPKLKHIEVSHNKITMLPEAIANIQNLQVLQMNHNCITSLPISLGSLKNLHILVLSANKITSLPESIGELKRLTRLDLRCNSLRTLPPQIGTLSSLRHLILRCNELKTLPDSIGKLSSLCTLILRFNELDLLPSTMGDLRSLVELDLYGNNLTYLPSEIGQLQDLDVITIKQNPLDSSLLRVMRRGTPAILSYLRAQLNNTALQRAFGGSFEPLLSGLLSPREFDMSALQLYYQSSGHLDTVLGEQITRITNLNLSVNYVYNLSPLILQKFRGLSTLSLENNNLWSLPGSISVLHNLTHLNLHGNSLHVLPQSLCTLPSLTYLDVSINRLQSLPTSIGSLQKLRELYLYGNQLSLLLGSVGSLVTLEILDLSRNQLSDIPPELGQMEELTFLDISYNRLPHLPIELFTIPKLQHLDLRSNLVSGIPSRIGFAAQLRYLDLSYNLLEGRLLPEIASLEALETLILDSQSLLHLPSLSRLSSLTYLSVSGNLLRGLPNDLKNLHQLRHLDFSLNYLSTIPAALSAFTHLETLLLHGNHFPPEIQALLLPLHKKPSNNVTLDFMKSLVDYVSSRTNITMRGRAATVLTPARTEIEDQDESKDDSTIPSNQKKNVLEWDTADVLAWLNSLDLGRYKNIFKLHMVDGETLLALTADELQNDLHVNDLRSLHLLRKSIEFLRNQSKSNDLTQA